MQNNGHAAQRIIFLFLDGVGLGEADPDVNPLARARLPVLQHLLGGARLTAGSGRIEGPQATLVPLDATLGMPGRPQSATGQAALLTGKNVPALVGEHYGPRPNPAVRAVVEAGTILSDLRAAGKDFLFVNAYPPGYFDAVRRGKRLLSVMPLAATAAGQALLTHDDLLHGAGFSADFTNAGWRQHLGFAAAPLYSAHDSGRRLATIAADYSFVLFEHWLSDVHGHQQDMDGAVADLETFDGFLGGLLEAADLTSTLIVVTSDHGNIEDLTTRHHTLNAVPCLLVGAHHAEVAAGLRNLADLAPALRRTVQVAESGAL